MSLPLREHRNIALFYVLSIASMSFFISGNWIFFWLRYMSYGTLGLVDASAFAFGMLMEIPTGAISDMVGKRRTLILAGVMNLVGVTIIASATGLTQIVVGFWVTQIGWAFFSGASEAMAYDSLLEVGQESQFDAVLGASLRLGTVANILTTLIGGVMWNIHFRLPHYGWAAMGLVILLTAFALREPATATPREPVTLRGYLRQVTRGGQQLTQRSLRPYLPLMFTLIGIHYLFSFGLVLPAIATRFHFLADEQAILFAVLGMLSAWAVGLLPALRRRFSDWHGLLFLCLLMGVGWMVAAAPLSHPLLTAAYGATALILIRVAGSLATPWVSVIVNRQIPSSDRATTLSTVALVSKLPYVISAILAGWMIERGVLWGFNLGVAGLLLAVLGLSLYRFRMAGPALSESAAPLMPESAGNP